MGPLLRAEKLFADDSLQPVALLGVIRLPFSAVILANIDTFAGVALYYDGPAGYQHEPSTMGLDVSSRVLHFDKPRHSET